MAMHQSVSANSYALVETAWGVVGVLVGSAGVVGLIWPTDRAQAERAARQAAPQASRINPDELPSRLAGKLADYFAGRSVDFATVPVDLSVLAEFHQRTLTALRSIGHGRTISYGQLARRIGCRGGARAVGMAMAKNPVPVIVPCHRVLRSDGSLGGFSAAGGVEVKRRLLELEASPRREFRQ